MAEEEPEESKPVEPVEQRSLLRYLPLILLVLLLQAGGAYFALERYVFRPEETATVSEDEAGRPRTIPETDEPETSVDLEPFLVNARGTEARLLVRAEVTLGVAPKGAASEIRSDLNHDRVRDAVISALGNADDDRLHSVEGREKIKEEIKERINAFLYRGQVVQVFFGVFTLQAMPGYKKG